MRYPRLTKELDRRCKLTEKDIKKIRIMRKEGLTLQTIADEFNVHYVTIAYWTNPKIKKNVQKYAREHCRHHDKERWRESSEYIRRVNPLAKLYGAIKSKERRLRIKQLN